MCTFRHIFNKAKAMKPAKKPAFKPHAKFTPEEDQKLRECVDQNGLDWKDVIKHLPGRTVRQVRERYRYYLSPDLSTEPWTDEDDDRLRNLYEYFPKKWVIISKCFPHRTDAMIKYRYQFLVRRAAKIERNARKAAKRCPPRAIKSPPPVPLLAPKFSPQLNPLSNLLSSQENIFQTFEELIESDFEEQALYYSDNF